MTSIVVDLVSQNNVDVLVTPVTSNIISVTTPPNNSIFIDRGAAGPPGPPGPNTIGGYPISVTDPSNFDALMFVDNEWTNVPQVEITDGGNF